MTDLVGGAAVGAAFGELLSAVLEVTHKAIEFRPILNRFELTLNSIKPMVDEIVTLNRELNLPEKETRMFTDMLAEAADLVRKSSAIHGWKFWKRYLYAKKLTELEASLERFLGTVVQAMQSRDCKKVLVVAEQIDSKMGRLGLSSVNGGVGCDRRRSVILRRPCGVPGVPAFVVGLEVPLRDLKRRLLEGGDAVVVVSAPAGCGKTTLAKLLCYDHQIQEIYQENIFFVTVSNRPNVRLIVQNLFQHKVGTVPEFQSDDDAIVQMENLLKQTAPALLVLDDVWSGSESLVEKFVFPISNYKVLVTSRHVLPRFNSTYNLHLLNDEDAMTLFCHSAFPPDRSSSVPDDLLNEILRGCGGFPLALNVVGKSLCGQPEVIWRKTLKQWCQGCSIFDSNSDLLIRLRTSLDVLDENGNAKECFLDLGLFPEDQRISAATLMDMWVELYNLDEEGPCAIANVHELCSRNLINLVLTRNVGSEEDGYYNEYFVMQHGLLRELAIHQSSQEPVEQRKRLIMNIRRNHFPKWSFEQMQQPFHAHVVSISTDETFSSSWDNMQLPVVEVLILNFQTMNYNLPEFMEKMDRLKVLIITNYGFCPAELGNFYLLGCLSSLKRIRLDHVSLSSLRKPAQQLRNLQKISLTMCEIGSAFSNFPHMFPNLSEIDIDCCDDLVELPEGLCDIACLKKLSINKCHELKSLPKGFGKLTNLAMLRLLDCTKLIGLPESIGSLHKLMFLDISGCLNMTTLPIQICGMCSLEKLSIRGCDELSKLPPSLKDLKKLKTVICDEETAHLWEPFKIHLTNLNINVLEEDINLNWLQNLQQ